MDYFWIIFLSARQSRKDKTYCGEKRFEPPQIPHKTHTNTELLNRKKEVVLEQRDINRKEEREKRILKSFIGI